MVRDAEDIIGTVVRHMMEQVDHVIVADNLSKDRTRDILDLFRGNITVMDDPDPAYRQSEKMTHLAMMAKKCGANYVVPFDADEYWTTREGTLKSVIEEGGADVYEGTILNYIPTITDDDLETDPTKRIRWRFKDSGHLVKVACKTDTRMVIAMGNHAVRYPHQPSVIQHQIMVRHFPWRTAQQFVEKMVVGAAALDLTDLPYDVGQHWRDYARLAEDYGTDALKDIFRTWFYSQDPYKDDKLVYDPVGGVNAR